MNQADKSLIRVELTVTGVVQAVGFRPFVYRRATAHGLGGSVKNTGDAGVEIVLEGHEESVEAFLEDLNERPPPLSVVESVEINRRESMEQKGVEAGDVQRDRSKQFKIAASTDNDGGTGTIPPDTGICDACLADVRDQDSRYHNYWATSCVDCGPRYTVIEELPYDRPRTTMQPFQLCEDCHEDYTDPTDRRYHAQTIACPECGPSLSLLNRHREELATGTNALAEAGRRLIDGDILAIRGIGGTHLACLATDQSVVKKLRERTGRPAKPFALMAHSIEAIEQFARVTEQERRQLSSVRRPIVVLQTNSESASSQPWLESVAPGLHTVGVMLPYAGLHHLLFDWIEEPLVMTSANHPGQPMATTVDDIYTELDTVIDAALVHDREIAARCDDSVVRFVDETRRFLRRSRGWVPSPLPRQTGGPPVIAFGAEFDNTLAIARDDEVLLSQHLGDIDGPATETFLKSTVTHLTELFGTDPAIVACDLHPQFITSKLANAYVEEHIEVTEAMSEIELGNPIRVQHHHAHAAALLGEHDCERATVITIDGTGYGPDGTIWGGEVLDATRHSFERVGGLGHFRLPGGEAAVRQPARILASLLADETQIERLLVERSDLSAAEVATVCESVNSGINAPKTTSAGRYLDAVSALLDICTKREYQGEPAIRLEAAAADGNSVPISHERGELADKPSASARENPPSAGGISTSGDKESELSVPYAERGNEFVIDTQELVRRLTQLWKTHSKETVAATAQAALAEALANIAIEAGKERDVSTIGVTGGVAYNEAISRRIRECVQATDHQFLGPEQVPPGDAGISYGQAIVASAQVDAKRNL